MESVPKTAKSVEELGFVGREIVSVRQDQKAYEAFQIMKEKKLSALPIVDSQNRVIGCISSNDIKQLGFDMRYFGLLEHSVLEYLHSLRTHSTTESEPYNIKMTIPIPDVVSVLPNQDLRRVLRLLTFYEIHRVFVADSQGKLLDVITLRDVLKVLFEDQRS